MFTKRPNGFWRKVIWVSSVLCLVSAVLALLGMLIGMFNTFQAMTLFGVGDPQILAGAISELLVGVVLSLPFIVPQFVLAIWAIRQLGETSVDLEELEELQS